MQLVRTKIGDARMRIQIYDRGSRKIPCVVCGEKNYGILLRIGSPTKKDVGICDQCVCELAGPSIGIETENALTRPLLETLAKRPKRKRRKTTRKKATKKKTAKKAVKLSDNTIGDNNG